MLTGGATVVGSSTKDWSVGVTCDNNIEYSEECRGMIVRQSAPSTGQQQPRVSRVTDSKFKQPPRRRLYHCFAT